jgi:TolA-binding protein
MAHHQPAAPKPGDDSGANRGGKLRALVERLPLPKSKKARIITAALALVVIGNLFVLGFWLPALVKPEAKRHTSLTTALAALDRNQLLEAKRLATMLRGKNEDSSVRDGALFILGAVASADAAHVSQPEQAAAYKNAAELLSDSKSRGFPGGRESQGWYLLGKSLCLAGEFEASRQPLEEASKFNPPFKNDLFELLAIANSNGPDADLATARKSSDRYLKELELSSDELGAAELVAADISMKLGDGVACREALARISANSASGPAGAILSANLLMREGRVLLAATDAQEKTDAAKRKFEQAIAQLNAVQRMGAMTEAQSLKAKYLTGICRLEMGQDAAALDKFAEVRRLSPKSDESIAAILQAADGLLKQGRQTDAMALYKQLAKSIGDPAGFKNAYLPIEEVRRRMLAAYEQNLRASKFDEAAELARLMQPLFPDDRGVELRAELLRSTAKYYLSQAGGSGDQRGDLETKARATFRQAGVSFARLAELQAASRAYTDDLWNAADCAMQGHDYKHAVSWLDLYLKNESRRRRATALVMLGESQLALGETDKGVATLDDCIAQFPTDPASYQARLLAAKGYIEKGDSAKAEELLRVNLEGGTLAPQSPEWRDSLFALGFLLEREGKYSEAITRLDDAMARYPSAPQAIEARYLTADAFRHLARDTDAKLRSEKIESLRNALAKQFTEYLNAAVIRYEQLQNFLTQREQQNETGPNDRAILRNTYFGLATALFDLGRFNDAISVYSRVVNQYRNQPEALDALVQIANCWNRLDRPFEARGAIAQAKATLNRLDKQADFKLTTNYSRDEWTSLLDQMAKL